MSFVPPDPGRILATLRTTVSELKTLVELHPEDRAYSEALAATEKAVAALESFKTSET